MPSQGVTIEVPAADADLARGELVKLNSGQAERTDSDTDDPVGVVQEVPGGSENLSSGDPVTICVSGLCEALVDGSGTSLSQFDELMPSNTADSGKLVSNTGNASEVLVGEVMDVQDGGSDGELAQILLYDNKVVQ